MQRLDAVRRLLKESDADGIVVSSIHHVRWLSGFTGSAALVLVGRDRVVLATDGRYRDQARSEVTGFEILVASGELWDSLFADRLLSGKILLQGEHVSALTVQRLDSPRSGNEFCVREELLERLVCAKEPSEIELIRKAQAITEEVFDHLIEWLRPGLTEREVAAEIVCQHLARGAERMSFDPIVASGPNSSLPHARPGDRRLQIGDVVILDMGCLRQGYASDMTRTIGIGEIGGRADGVYRVVREAQEKAIDAARSGMLACDLDRVAREVIARADFGDFFTHGLGHGVGMQVHEWPRVSSRTEYTLPENTVVTIEPGVYIPGEFGVRIEDLIVLRPDGNQNLTRAGKELISVT